MRPTPLISPLIVSAILFLFLTVTNLFSQSNIPGPRHLHHMVYDDHNKQVLLYGGSTGNYTYVDLWALSSSGWKKLSENGPPERVKAAFAFDTHRKKAVLFGGSGVNNNLLDDTWEWDGTEWKQNMIKGPSIRNHAMAVYDARNKVVIMFGGVGPGGLLSDTWTFDGASWKKNNSDGPTDCLPHGIVYNEASEKVILVTLSAKRNPNDDAHAKNDLWEWTGTSWKNISDAPLTTSSNLQALSSFGKDAIVLFDGSDVSNDKCKTWKFTGGQWESTISDGPSKRYGHAMVYDKVRNKTLLFGGANSPRVLNDLWEWDGAVWKLVSF